MKCVRWDGDEVCLAMECRGKVRRKFLPVLFTLTGIADCLAPNTSGVTSRLVIPDRLAVCSLGVMRRQVFGSLVLESTCLHTSAITMSTYCFFLLQ